MAGKCGECTMCCKVLKIVELDKPKNEWCKHCDKGVGCTIYEDRPPACVDFECVWLQTQDTVAALEPGLRPDKCHVVFVAPDTLDNVLNAHVDLGYLTAWREEPVRGFLGAISRHTVIALIAGKRFWRIEDGRASEVRMSEPDEDGMQYMKGYVRDEARKP